MPPKLESLENCNHSFTHLLLFNHLLPSLSNSGNSRAAYLDTTEPPWPSKRQTCEIQRCFREDNNKWSNTLVRISPWQLSIGQCIILKRIFKLRMHAGRILHLNCEPIELLTTMTCARTTETETALHCGSAKQRLWTGDFPGSSQIGMAEVWAFLHFFLLCHVKFLNAPGWLEGNLERCGRILTLFQEDSRDWKMLRVRKNSSREGENEEIGHEQGDSGSGKSGLKCNI